MPPPLSFSLSQGMDGFAAEDWDRLAGADNPFMSHAWLKALEDTGCVGPGTGWQAVHAALRDAEGGLLAACPLYLKSHSYGEYVFDHAWAQAYEAAGGDYYPKLVCASPFTPVSGPRILAKDAEARLSLIEALPELCARLRSSSLHVQFCREDENTALTGAGFLPRLDRQYWWDNQGYGDFDAFLASLSSNRRKVIRRERRDVGHLRFQTLTGSEVTEAHLDHLYGFIQDTYDRKWGRPYLNRNFFSAVPRHNVVLMLAWEGADCIAGAINFKGGNTLYGRQWGCSRDVAFLHFELCYYQAIELAIAEGIERVEAGTQGEHKLARGYIPYPVYSAHLIRHSGLRRAVGDYLIQERPAILAEIEAIRAGGLPYRQE